MGTSACSEPGQPDSSPRGTVGRGGPVGCRKVNGVAPAGWIAAAHQRELRLFDQPQTYLRLDQTDPPDVRLVFQNPALLASLTVEENVGFLLRERAQLSRQEIRDRVHACLEAVGLFDVAHLYAGN